MIKDPKQTPQPNKNMSVKTNTQQVLSIANSQLGLQEIPLGSNWGTHVKKYLLSVGINFPASWCMAFVYWVFQQAGLSDKLIKTGGVLNMWNKVDKKYKSSTPTIGSIFIMDMGKGLGHTGIVENIVGNKIFTIEGNTNDTGSREGVEVAKRTRLISSCKGFINVLQ